MSKKPLPERKRLAAIFASFAILLTGTTSLMQSMSLDYYSVINTLEKAIPAAITIGGLGWVMGMILDQPRRRKKLSYSSLFSSHSTKETPSVTAASPESA